jgi:hypothetical protein
MSFHHRIGTALLVELNILRTHWIPIGIRDLNRRYEVAMNKQTAIICDEQSAMDIK